MMNILFGPDGVGKTTVAAARQAESDDLIVLHGTKQRSWFRRYGDLLRQHDLHEGLVPPDEDFLAKIAFANMAALALAKSGHRLVIDGHSLHKTAINTAAGLVEPHELANSHTIEELLAGPLQPYFQPLLGPSITHTHVIIGDSTPPADELQCRLSTRGRSKWDPETVEASQAQVEASYALETALRRRGAQVLRTSSVLPPHS